jgi:hypothetical protein
MSYILPCDYPDPLSPVTKFIQHISTRMAPKEGHPAAISESTEAPDASPDASTSQTPVQSGTITPDTPQEEPHLSEKTREKTKLVKSAALSNATAAQKPSLLTRRMFMVIYTYKPKFN